MMLTEFLLARIAEDEASARGIATGAWEDATSVTRRESDHVFRWSPDRVLAECEAKRRIVEEHAPVDYGPLGMDSPNACHICGIDAGMSDWEYVRDSFPCPTLRMLALPYADRPDYRGEWKP